MTSIGHAALVLFFVSNTFAITEEQQKFLKDVNQKREEFAMEFKIPDMHLLRWDDDLVEILKPLDLSTDWSGIARMTWRYGQVSYQNFSKDVDQEMEEYTKLSEDEKSQKKKSGSMKQLELLHPRQTVIGCHSIPNGDSGNVIICLLGTEGQAWDFPTESPQTPGSGCFEHYRNKGGLCVPEYPSKIAYFGHPEDFVHELNSVRQKYANLYNITNMHFLTWSPELVRVLSLLDMDRGWPEARKTWRYAQLTSYRNIAEVIKNDMKPNESMTSVVYSMGSIELVSPSQTVIGCSIKKEKNKVAPICLIGAIGKAELWDFEVRSPNRAGSNCSVHYHNQNGICMPEDSRKVNYLGSSADFLTELNSLRREYAKTLNITNMHSLYWNESSIKILDSLDWSQKWPEARINWRFVNLLSYRNPADYIQKGMEEYQEMTDDQKKEIYKSKVPSGLDLIYPLQTSIGCGSKWDGATVFPVCILGNVGMWPELSFNPDPRNVPGSKCLPGFENVDGLCSRPMPAPKPIQKQVPACSGGATETQPEPDMASTGFSPYFGICVAVLYLLV